EIILCWWLDALFKLWSEKKAQAECLFMDGPYSYKVTREDRRHVLRCYHDTLSGCARLCKSQLPLPDTEIAFVWGQNDHVLRRFFQTTALPRLRRLHVESPAWQGGPGELFLGLAARGRPLEEMTVTTSLDLARTRRVTFTLRFDREGNAFSE